MKKVKGGQMKRFISIAALLALALSTNACGKIVLNRIAGSGQLVIEVGIAGIPQQQLSTQFVGSISKIVGVIRPKGSSDVIATAAVAPSATGGATLSLHNVPYGVYDLDVSAVDESKMETRYFATKSDVTIGSTPAVVDVLLTAADAWAVFGVNFNSSTPTAVVLSYDIISSATGNVMSHIDNLLFAGGTAYQWGGAMPPGTLFYSIKAWNGDNLLWSTGADTVQATLIPGGFFSVMEYAE